MSKTKEEETKDILVGSLTEEPESKSAAGSYDYWSDDDDKDVDDDDEDGEDGDDDSADDDSEADDISSDADEKPESRRPDVGLVARAIQAGLKPDRIANMSADVLESAVEVLEESKGSRHSDEDEKEPEKFSFDFDDDYDEDVAEKLNKLNDHYHTQHKAMLAEIKELKKGRADDSERAQRESNNRFISWVDSQFVELAESDEGYADIFGKAKVDDLKDNSPEFKKRVAVIQEIGRQRRAHPEYSDKKLLDLSIKVALSDDVSKIEAGKLRNKVKNHKENRVSVRSQGKERVVGKSEPVSRGTKSAESFVKRYLKKFAG